jgi:hypothetical protein
VNLWRILAFIIPPLIEWGLYSNHLVRPSVHTSVTDISASTGRNDFIFDIWLWQGDLYRVSPFQVYRTSTSCLQCDLEFFMFTVMKTRNSYLSFYWKKWFYIWYMALAWWLVPCLPFPGLPQIYFLFTVRLTNEWVGVFLARRGVQHLVITFSDLVKEFGIYYPLANELAKGYSNATFRNILVNTLESTSFNGFWPHLVHT